MKGADRYMKILLVVFREKIHLGQLDLFLTWPLGRFLQFDWAWSKLSDVAATIGSLNSQDMISFMITTGSLNSQNMISFMITTGSLNSQGMISFMITTGSLNSQDMIRIPKQSRHDFSGKHLCDGYCMNIK